MLRPVGRFWSVSEQSNASCSVPRSTPAATRGEGLVAVLDTCALVNDPCEGVLDLLLDTVSHEMWSQYTPELSHWLTRPGDVVGGFSGGIMDVDMRNDFTQHNLSSLLGAERHLRAADGVELPGGPRWTPEKQAAYTPPETAAVDALLAPVVEVRGRPTRWDAAAEAAAEGGPHGE